MFGLRHYMPYLICDVVLHLTLGTLLFVLMTRSGVRAWLATAAASLFVLFGSGYQDIARAFQIGFVGSLVFAFAQLLCADHDDGLDRRDAVGLVAGLAALMCSGIALPMIAVVGIATFLHRGVRVALFHTFPLALVYAVWYEVIGKPDQTSYSSAGQTVRFVVVGLRAVFGHLGQIPGVGFVLFAVLVIGSFFAWRGPWRPGKVPATTADSIALLAGLLLFFALTGSGRAGILGVPYAQTSRYLHIGAALLLVPLAVATEALVRRRRVLLIPAVAILVVGIPGNVAALVRFEHGDAQHERNYQATMLWVPRLPNIDKYPPALVPEPSLAPEVTLAWLRAAAADGKIPLPQPDALAARNAAQREVDRAKFAFAIQQACVHANPPCRLYP